MIKFVNVTKKFPLGNTAVENVSFEVKDNEFVFLVGPSGAGKTTILKLILREFSPTSGKIIVNDFDITSKKFKQITILRKNIGMIFQDFRIIFDKNVFENIAISLKIQNTPDIQIANEVKKVLQFVGLADKAQVFPAQLSAGELQRVAIARAVIGKRDIILADEPTGNLDPQTTWEIMKIFKKIDGKKTIIIASHNTDVVNSFQKRVIILKEGKLIKDEKKGGYQL